MPSCRSRTLRHRASPMRSTMSVESTMSVYSTVASARVGGAGGAIPVRNPSTASSASSACSQYSGPSEPASSTNRAPGMCSARYRPISIGT